MLLRGQGKQGWFALAVVALVMSFVVVAGGCGGGGGGGGGGTPDFAALDGKWSITGGSGTATAGGYTISLTAPSGNFTLDLQDEDENHGLFDLDGTSTWSATDNGQNIGYLSMSIPEDDHVNVTYRNGTYYGTTTVAPVATFTLKFLSDTTAQVTQTGTVVINDYTGSYRVTYTLKAESGGTPDFAALDGQWSITGGSGTATATVAGHSYTISLTAPSGNFTLDLQDEDENHGLFDLDGKSTWSATYNGQSTSAVLYSRDGEQANVTYSNGTYSGTTVEPGATFTWKFLSDSYTSATVRQTGTDVVDGYPVSYNVTYTLQKVTY
jgi:hypothetical protein